MSIRTSPGAPTVGSTSARPAAPWCPPRSTRSTARCTTSPRPARRPDRADLGHAAAAGDQRQDRRRAARCGWARPTCPASTASANHHHGESETAIYVVSRHARSSSSSTRGDEPVETRILTAPGDYVFVPPYVPHREENPDPAVEAVVVIARSTQEAIVVNLDASTGPRSVSVSPEIRTTPRDDVPCRGTFVSGKGKGAHSGEAFGMGDAMGTRVGQTEESGQLTRFVHRWEQWRVARERTLADPAAGWRWCHWTG